MFKRRRLQPTNGTQPATAAAGGKAGNHHPLHPQAALKRLRFWFTRIIAALVFACLRLPARRPDMTNILVVMHFQDEDIFLDAQTMKRFSLLTAFIVISLVGLTPTGAAAAVDGMISVISTDDNVLKVTPTDDGLFKVEFVGAGQAKLVVSADADLSDGERLIYQEYEFLIYDQAAEADHFDLLILDVVQHATADNANGVAAVGGDAADAASETGDAAADAAGSA